MTFKSTAIFRCDGCKVIESEPVEVLTDIMQARPPYHWLRVETHKIDGELTAMAIKFFCPHCAKLVESYLKGNTEEWKT
jgi:hypothetical protein